jgi:hypothetical protein
MIVPSMTSEELYREIISDDESVKKKAYYLALGMRREVVKSRTKHICRAFDYKTRKYNKWIIVIDYHQKEPAFYSAVHFLDQHGFNAVRVNADLESLTHFTPHFLERYNERFLKHEELSKIDLLKRFIAENPFDAISYFPQDPSKNPIFCRFKEGIGLGDEEILSEKGLQILHFRTYITNEMIHEGQLNDFNSLGELYDDHLNRIIKNPRKRA